MDKNRWAECPICKDNVFVKRMQYMRPLLAPLTPEQELMDKITDITGIVYVDVKKRFCPVCGRPTNEGAWAELERRINGGTAE